MAVKTFHVLRPFRREGAAMSAGDEFEADTRDSAIRALVWRRRIAEGPAKRKQGRPRGGNGNEGGEG